MNLAKRLLACKHRCDPRRSHEMLPMPIIAQQRHLGYEKLIPTAMSPSFNAMYKIL